MTTLQALHAQLDADPRQQEYLHIDPVGWTDAEREAGRALTARLIAQGDARAVGLLLALWPRDEARAQLDALLDDPRAGIVWAAARALDALHTARLHNALWPALRAGALGQGTLTLIAQQLTERGATLELLASLEQDQLPEVSQRAAIDALWSAQRLQQFGSPWWSALGQIKVALDIPVVSFRAPALATLREIIARGPGQAGLTAPAWEANPPALQALMRDVSRGRGALDLAGCGALEPLQRRALLLYAAREACHARSARALCYAAALGGAAHADLLDWAAASNEPALCDVLEAARALVGSA